MPLRPSLPEAAPPRPHPRYRGIHRQMPLALRCPSAVRLGAAGSGQAHATGAGDQPLIT